MILRLAFFCALEANFDVSRAVQSKGKDQVLKSPPSSLLFAFYFLQCAGAGAGKRDAFVTRAPSAFFCSATHPLITTHSRSLKRMDAKTPFKIVQQGWIHLLLVQKSNKTDQAASFLTEFLKIVIFFFCSSKNMYNSFKQIKFSHEEKINHFCQNNIFLNFLKAIYHFLNEIFGKNLAKYLISSNPNLLLPYSKWKPRLFWKKKCIIKDESH